MVATPYKYQLNPNHFIGLYICCASNQLASYEYWTKNIPKIFTLQMNFPRPYVFDLPTDDSNPNFHSAN